MSDKPPSTLRRLLSRTSSRSVTRAGDNSNASAITRPDVFGTDLETKDSPLDSEPVAQRFRQGCELLRVTRKKARTRTFTIDTLTGSVAIDGNHKFSVDAIRHVRIGSDANHYRELCKISAEHEPLWISIVYALENDKLKVLHAICPSNGVLDEFRNSLTRLYQKRSRFLGAGHALFGPGHNMVDEDTWFDLLPSKDDRSRSRRGSIASSDSELTLPAKKVEPQMSFHEVESLCHRLHFNAPSHYLRNIFDRVDERRTGYLNFPLFKNFVNLLKIRHDLVEIYEMHKSQSQQDMTRQEFITFLKEVQCLTDPPDVLNRIFEKAREPTSFDKREMITSENFTAYILSRQNALLAPLVADMSHPVNEYFISSSHNTYLTGRQLGDESSIEPYIRVLQKGCRCVEIDIWSNSDGLPEVRHGRAFTSSVSLEAVLKAVDKYAFIVSPWPLFISLEIRCGPLAQEIVADMLPRIFGEVLVTARLQTGATSLPSPEALRNKILLKIKSTTSLQSNLAQLSYDSSSQKAHKDLSVLDFDALDESPYSTLEDSSLSTSAAESEIDGPRNTSRTSSISSRSSSYSGTKGVSYRPFHKNTVVVDNLLSLAPYCKSIKFRNFSLPESKILYHIFSLSENTVKHFTRETSVQAMKHNTRYMMRVYPSNSRLMSSNFLPHHFWQQGVQMVAMNWQTHDLGMRLNDAFFASDEYSTDVAGYVLKPLEMRTWHKGQELEIRRYKSVRWYIEIISGTQLPKGSIPSGKVSPMVEMEIIRPKPSSALSTAQSAGKVNEHDRESRYRTAVVDDNGFNPRFNAQITFICHDDEDPCFTFLRFVVKDGPSGEVLAQCTLPLSRLQYGYRNLSLYDQHGERYIFSGLLIKVMRQVN